MTQPKLRVRASGHGGSGYKHPFTGDVVPGVTTVLKKLDKPAVAQWAVDNTAAFAVANIDALLSRSEEQGFGFLRWYWKRDPIKGDMTDIRNYSDGVLNDAAELGTMIHEWIAAEHDMGTPYPDTSLAPPSFWEMVDQWNAWKTEHDVVPIMTETTFWSRQYGYAGTADGVWMVDGKRILLDVKSSRNVWDEHYMQLAALGACESALVETSTGWNEEPLPAFGEYAFLHIRPTDIDKTGAHMEPFCRLETVDMGEIPFHFEAFLGLLAVSNAQNRVKEYRKGEKE